MKPNTLTGFTLALLLSITFTGKAMTYHIDGYVVTEAEHHVVKNQMVEIADETGNTIAWFITGPNGLYSGNFEVTDSTIREISVQVSRTCDLELVIYSQQISLNNPYLICNFFVCETTSCNANFYYTQIDGNDLIFSFTDVSTGNISSWFWDFGDQQTSTLQNPVHQYQDEDHYEVILTITMDSCTDFKHKWVNAFPTDCLAGFTFEQVNQGNDLMVHFFDESIGDYNHIHWDFGDGGMPSNQPDPWHQYIEPGEYEVELHIWKQGGGGPGCDHDTRKIVRVQPASTCYALFTSVQNHSGLFEVQFTDASIGQLDTWFWVFGDGETSSLQHPVHFYENPGEYEVSLTIDGPEGSSTFVRMLQVEHSADCFANFEYYQPSLEEPLIIFENLSIGENPEFWWDFGDGTTSNDTAPIHLFPLAGNYEVILSITGFGCTDSIFKMVEVLAPPPCHAAFSFTSQSPESLEIFFTNQSTGLINSYQWDFGDGDFSSEENPVHSYTSWGNFSVWLKIEAMGCIDSVEHLVQIAEPEFCQAAFSYIQEYPQNPVILFLNNSVGEGFASQWSFGDGNFSTETNPQHQYTQPGQYSVLLKIETSTNCSDSVVHNIEILPPLAISGSVMAGSNLFGYGEIFLYKTDAQNGWIVYDQAPLGEGSFEFSGLTPGSYLLQAIPDFAFPYPVIPNYFPTYFGDNNKWADAEILLTSNLPETIFIHLSACNNFFSGKASIKGAVTLLPDDNPAPLVIFIVNQSGEWVDYSVVDISGDFAFDEIPYGIYQLYPEKVGKTGIATTVEVTEMKPENHDIFFVETANRIYPDITLTEETDKNQIRLSPNPCDDFIHFYLKNGNLNGQNGNLVIMTTGGKIARKYTNIHSTGTLDISGLAAGIYFLRFDFENEIVHHKIIVQHH